MRQRHGIGILLVFGIRRLLPTVFHRQRLKFRTQHRIPRDLPAHRYAWKKQPVQPAYTIPPDQEHIR